MLVRKTAQYSAQSVKLENNHTNENNSVSSSFYACLAVTVIDLDTFTFYVFRTRQSYENQKIMEIVLHIHCQNK